MSIPRFVPTLAGITFSLATAFAQMTSTRTFNFLPVGLASSETGQINVTNFAENSSTGTAASCTGTISFLNASGSAIPNSSQPFSVTSGQTVSASLPFGKAGLSARGEIRAIVTLTIPASSAPPCELASTLETYDKATGVTHVYVGGGGEIAFGLGRGH